MPPSRSRSRKVDDAATREAIITAAAAIVAEDGYEALNMRDLAERSDIATMTLYRHVENKERLLSALAERLFSEIDLPESGSEAATWEDEALGVFRGAHRTLLQHPELVQIIAKQHMNGQVSYAAGERALSAMRRGGMSGDEAAAAFIALVAYTVGFTQRQLQKSAANMADAWSVVSELPREKFENYTTLSHLLIPPPTDAHFDKGLKVLLRGFAQRLYD
jgi:TetR/AcrR family tetracycline transcriptional repressor